MPQSPEDADTQSWHRYFATEANNLAWDLAVSDRTYHQDLERLNAAHASALHWSAIGPKLNIMRAKMLVAEIHALLGFATSFPLATEVLEYFDDPSNLDWERAFAHTIHAHAAYVAGNHAAHKNSYTNAANAIDEIASDEDRALVVESFTRVPGPGSS